MLWQIKKISRIHGTEMYLAECELRKLAPRTIEGHRKILRPLLLWLGDNEQVIKD